MLSLTQKKIHPSEKSFGGDNKDLSFVLKQVSNLDDGVLVGQNSQEPIIITLWSKHSQNLLWYVRVWKIFM